ncbi:MAG: sugar phosphate isomerase/epimerase family protein [Candidatus Bathyarchaeia archaeon]|nr:sugar phosphate isomerase/epimerase [Candidatus Bathyarchaeota archaeon]
MGKLKIGLAIWSLGLTETLGHLKQQLATAVEIGVKSVQLWCVDYGPNNPCVLDPDRCVGKMRTEIKELVNSYGLEISGFCAQLVGPIDPGHGWPGSALGDPRGLRERVEKTKKSLKLAADFGSPIVTTHPGEILVDKSDPAYKTMRKSCLEIARYGEEVGGIFCIETGQEKAETLRSFIEDVGSEALKVNYDPANMLRHGVVEGVKILAPWIVHTHAKDHNPETHKATVGEGLVPWDEYIATLRAIGYDGWYALEDETGKDVINSLKRGRVFLERY